MSKLPQTVPEDWFAGGGVTAGSRGRPGSLGMRHGTLPERPAGPAAGRAAGQPGGDQQRPGGGGNRVSFGLVDRDYMPVRPESVELRAVYYEPGAPTGQVRHRMAAEFLEWPPEGRRGVFVAQVEFDQAGTATGDTSGIWELHATFDYPEEEALTIGTVVSVASEHRVPFIGDPAPPSNTPTAATVENLHTISSSPEPDPALYQLSVAEAVEDGKPAVITFATPAFCVSATCGPQVSDLSELAHAYQGQVNFVHVEVYRDPHLIEPADPSRELVPAVAEWGLVSEPWTFVVGSDGTIGARFEQYVPPAPWNPHCCRSCVHNRRMYVMVFERMARLCYAANSRDFLDSRFRGNDEIEANNDEIKAMVEN